MNAPMLKVAFFPVLAASLYALLFNQNWVGEWNWTVDAAIGSTTLAAPVVAATGAFVGLSLRRRSSLLVPSARWRLVVIRGVAGVWAIGVLAFVITAAVALTMTGLATHGGPLTGWALLLGPAILLVASSVGTAVGYLVPHRGVAVLVAPLYFAVGALIPVSIQVLLRQGPVTGSLAGLDYAVSTAVAVFVGAVAIAGLCVLSLSSTSRRDVLVGSGCAALLISAGLISMENSGERFEASPEQPTTCETQSGLTVCVAPSNSAKLAALTESVSRAALGLRSAGAEVPSQFDALVPYTEADPQRGMLPNVSATDPSHRLVLYPAPCAEWLDPAQPPPMAVYEAQQLMVDVMAAEEGRGSEIPSRFEAWLKTTSPDERRSWLTRSYAQLKSCDLNSIRLPV